MAKVTYETIFADTLGMFASGAMEPGMVMPTQAARAKTYGCGADLVGEVHRRFKNLGLLEVHRLDDGFTVETVVSSAAEVVRVLNSKDSIPVGQQEALLLAARRARDTVGGRPSFVGQAGLELSWHQFAVWLNDCSQQGTRRVRLSPANLATCLVDSVFVPNRDRVATPTLTQPESKYGTPQQVVSDLAGAAMTCEWPPSFKTAPQHAIASALGCRDYLVSEAFDELRAWAIFGGGPETKPYYVGDMAVVLQLATDPKSSKMPETVSDRCCQIVQSTLKNLPVEANSYRAALLERLANAFAEKDKNQVSIVAGQIVDAVRVFDLVELFNSVFKNRLLTAEEFGHALKTLMIMGVLPPGRRLPSQKRWRDSFTSVKARSVEVCYKTLAEEGFVQASTTSTVVAPAIAGLTMAKHIGYDPSMRVARILSSQSVAAAETAVEPFATLHRRAASRWSRREFAKEDTRLGLAQNVAKVVTPNMAGLARDFQARLDRDESFGSPRPATSRIGGVPKQTSTQPRAGRRHLPQRKKDSP